MGSFNISEFMDAGRLLAVVRAVIILVVGMMAAGIISRLLGRLAEKRLDRQHYMLVKRFSYYGLTVLVLLSFLKQLGFDLHVLLGAAGILTVAIGFASQTSMSNLISGLFVVIERPFVVGDSIRIGGSTTGEVLEIGLLSTNLRTNDNLMVRIPNEMLMKAEITNLTRFPIRRFDLTTRVDYGEDLAAFSNLLVSVADRVPLCLDEPRPAVQIQTLGEKTIDVNLSVWAKSERFAEMQRALQLELKTTLDRVGSKTPRA